MKEYILFETVADFEDALEFILDEDVRDVTPNSGQLEIAVNMYDLRMVERILDSAVIPYQIYR